MARGGGARRRHIAREHRREDRQRVDEAAYKRRAHRHARRRALCRHLEADYFGWERLAILHDDTVWAADGAEGFKRRFEADGSTVLRRLDGNSTVGFELAAFDGGALHVSSLVERRAVEPSVIVVICSRACSRAFFAFLRERLCCRLRATATSPCG